MGPASVYGSLENKVVCIIRSIHYVDAIASCPPRAVDGEAGTNGAPEEAAKPTVDTPSNSHTTPVGVAPQESAEDGISKVQRSASRSPDRRRRSRSKSPRRRRR